MNRLQNFKIANLFGYQNVDLHFDNNVLILMGENGLGKTSILNSLYFSLTKKWKKLQKINFESISLTIDDKCFVFTKKQLNSYLQNTNKRESLKYKNLRSDISKKINFEDLNIFISNRNEENIDKHRIIYEYVKKHKLSGELNNAPVGLIVELIDKISSQPDFSNIEKLNNFLETEFTTNIIYFPTYRRVEEELHNLGKLRRIHNDDLHDILWEDDDREETEDLEEETLIQFGMEDVEERIKKVVSKINDSSIKGFAKVTGEMLHQLQEGFPKLSENEILNINRNNIEIILNRVKNNLSQADRDNILMLLDSKELLHKPELAYFLTKLEDIYLRQRDLDNCIKDFEKVINNYLVGKQMFFDESLVTLNIYNTMTSEKVELNQLSSGEKQIISLFSKIYLEDLTDLMIFFDEPELSLSIKWQKQLLPHVMESDKCKFLLAVTHSPFIFSNKLENFAIGMNVFID